MDISGTISGFSTVKAKEINIRIVFEALQLIKVPKPVT